MSDVKPVPTPYTVNGFGGDFHVIARTEPHGVAVSARVAPYRNEIETAQFMVDACNSHVSLVAALEAQEAAELYRSNRCEECLHSTRDWACCGPCSVRFGTAIDLRRAALKAAKGAA